MAGLSKGEQKARNAWDDGDASSVDDLVEYLPKRGFNGVDLLAININNKQLLATPAQARQAAIDILNLLEEHEVNEVQEKVA